MTDPETLQAAMRDPRHGFWAFSDEQEADEETFLRVLRELLAAVEAAGITYALIGGIASTVLGRKRLTHDIDIFVSPDDAHRALAVMRELGYATQRTDPNWIFKGFCDGVIIDVIFKSSGGVFLDDEMRQRVQRLSFHDIPVCVAPPEDLLVMKAIATDEDSPRHWHDALGLLAGGDVPFDWEYLVQRARRGVRRVLSLLLYAQADDLPVPAHVVPQLYDLLHDRSDAEQAGSATTVAAADSDLSRPQPFAARQQARRAAG